MSCKHKERKPKKPHYIPRPWGKPYNYKCFQCPFTCMEKSHLYNHMKYSLCKNSLSLLIESDWPFKKGSPVQPEQLRLQQAEPPVTVDAREEEQDKEAEPPPHQEAQEAPESRGGGRSKQEAELVMADVFSLEEQLLRARSVEVESKLRHYRLSLSERWRVLSAPPKPPDGVAPPCYPAPSLECSDASGLNLSLLGVGYPLAPGLLSYLNPAAAPPFLPGRHPDRALLPPHLYYPFLCEHGFGVAAEAGKIVKPQPTPQSTPQPTPKPGLWKVPALQTSWSSSPDLLMERGRGREDRAGWQQDTGVKRAAGPSDVQDVPVEKKKVLDFHLPTLKNTYKSASDASQTHSSSRGAASLPPRLTAHQEEEEGPNAKRRDSNLDPAALLRDFTTLMHEYQSTEQRAASLPQQRHLWAHLGKIRAELAHIQEALEHRAWPNEGPLDLSVRRQPAGGPDQLGGRGIPGETKDVENESEEETDEEEEPKDLYHKCSALDALVRLAPPHAPLLKGEVLDGGVALWHGRTTKCEADSSVLLCSKTPNRPPSIQQLDTLPSIDSV